MTVDAQEKTLSGEGLGSSSGSATLESRPISTEAPVAHSQDAVRDVERSDADHENDLDNEHSESKEDPTTPRPPTIEDGTIAGQFNSQTNYVPVTQIVIIFLTLSVNVFTTLLDQTTLAITASIIGTTLDAGNKTSFITDAYFITSTSFQLVYGRMSDFFGRKPLIIAFMCMFFIGSLGSSLSPNVISLVCFRAFTGIWGGGIVTLTQSTIGDTVSLRERGKYQGILGSVIVSANGLGPILGALFVEKASWRDQYRLMLPLSAFGIFTSFKFLPLKKVEGDWKKKAAAIDYIGAGLSFSATALVVLGLSWAGGSYGWDDAHVLAPLIIGLVIAALFILWQWKGCSESRPPLLPLHMFRSKIVIGAAITQCTNGWLTYATLFYLPQFYQLVYGYTPILAGALIVPLICIQSISSTGSGLIVTRTGRYREILLSGWTLWSIGLGLLSTLNEGSGVGKQVGYSLLTGFGVGQTMQVALVALQGAVPRKEMAVVTAMRNFARNLGGALGLALGSSIVSTVTVNKLTPLGWTASLVRQALNDPSALYSGSVAATSSSTLNLSEEQIEQLRQAYSQGFKYNFILLASIAAASLIVTAVLMRQKAIDRDDDQALRERAKKELEEKKEMKRLKRQAKAGGIREGGLRAEEDDTSPESHSPPLEVDGSRRGSKATTVVAVNTETAGKPSPLPSPVATPIAAHLPPQ